MVSYYVWVCRSQGMWSHICMSHALARVCPLRPNNKTQTRNPNTTPHNPDNHTQTSQQPNQTQAAADPALEALIARRIFVLFDSAAAAAACARGLHGRVFEDEPIEVY